MICIKVIKFSPKEWLVIRISKQNLKSNAIYLSEVLDVFITQKQARERAGLINFIMKRNKQELEIIHKELEKRK